jgi:molecular chaperone Hsp33
MPSSSDTILHAVTEDRGFRVFVARTTDTVRGAAAAQGTHGSTTRHFGDLLTAAVLLRVTMAPSLRVQAILKGANGQGTLVADSHPSGATRGLVQLGDAAAVVAQAGAVLQMMRTLHDGRISQGLVEIPEGGEMSQAFMSYMQLSEQTVTTVGIATQVDGDGVRWAGGYLVQLVPDASRAALEAMTQRLVGRSGVERDELEPEAMLERLLGPIPYLRYDDTPVRYACWCDELRVVSALATLDRATLEELLATGEPVELSCDYCGKEYRIGAGRLRGMLENS